MSDVNERVSATGVDAAAAEAYRVLRSTLKFAAAEQPVRSVLVVDLDRREPSGVASHLAEAFARAGDGCVLIDTDSRTPGTTPGLTDLISGTADAGEVINRTGAGRAASLSAGTLADPDLLATERVPDVLTALLAEFDFAVLSSASLPEHGDALAIAPRVDAVILVVTSGRTRRPRAVEAREALDRVGANILGVVMLEGQRSRFW